MLDTPVFVGILTNEDLDNYAACEDKPGGIDPRKGFDEYSLPEVLMFLAWACELKALESHDYTARFGYEAMLYSYTDTAYAIRNL